jgi:sugar lactone lactonase YvrE
VSVDALHPPHDPAPPDLRPVTVLAEWAPGTFLENLAPGPDGSWWVTSPSHRFVERIDADGRRRAHVDLPAAATGVVADGDAALVACGEPGAPGWSLLRVDDAGYAPYARLDDVTFANGLVRRDDELVVADCLRGALVTVARDGRVADLLVDPLLAPADPDGPLPGVNGLALDPAGDLVLTSTGRGLVLRLRSGRLETVADRLVGDDLAVAADGTAYLATHTFDSILRLRPDGSRHDVAHLPGPTSVRSAPDGHGLVATTTGGLLTRGPDAGPARLVHLDVVPELEER